MGSRNKIIIFILLVWMLLVSLIIWGSESIFVSGSEKLEKDLARDSAHRVYHVSLSILNYMYLQNLDMAYWDEAYSYIQGKNPDFIQKNFLTDFYIDNKVNYLMLIDDQSKVVFSQGFDLNKKMEVPVEQEVLDFFKKNALEMLIQGENFYKIYPLQYGATGFVQLPDSSIAYFSLNWIKDTNDSEQPKGAMIFGKKITPDYLKTLSENLSYPVSLISIQDFEKAHPDKKIQTVFVNDESVYSEPLNEDTLVSYELLRDFNHKPIAIFQIEQSRKIYNESRKASDSSQLILFIFSLLGALGMSVLVYLFFRKQELITRSFERFVPHQLLDLLHKKDILAIDLGDNVKKNLSVLFLDIRNFTTISEGLSSQANFDFINALLKRIAPIISSHNGFIDKYIGDAIMALFPNELTSADDAVKSAKAISEELDKLNQETQFPIKVGIGINTGEAMLGIIGAKGRLEGTVISDMVNTAARIQGLTKTYQCELIISEQCYKAMQHPEAYSIHHVDDVLVKGKSVKVSIYSVE